MISQIISDENGKNGFDVINTVLLKEGFWAFLGIVILVLVFIKGGVLSQILTHRENMAKIKYDSGVAKLRIEESYKRRRHREEKRSHK